MFLGGGGIVWHVALVYYIVLYLKMIIIIIKDWSNSCWKFSFAIIDYILQYIQLEDKLFSKYFVYFWSYELV